MSRAFPRRMERVLTPIIPIVGQWVARHPGTISLGQGVVHYGPPADVAHAVAGAAHDARMHRYGLVRGVDSLLSAARAKLERENGVRFAGRQAVVCTAGSNMGFLTSLLAIADVDDEVILPSPYYFNHHMAIELAGCRPVVVPTDASYQLDLGAIAKAISSRTRAIVTVSPNNPTGAVYTPESLAHVNRLCRERNVYHVSDEAYEYFVYGDRVHFSPGSLPGAESHTISLYSLSKAYGMAGWRCGYFVVPTELETSIYKIQDTNLICPPIIAQVAAEAALNADPSWRRQQASSFPHVRAVVLDELSKLGSRCRFPEPDGAFYVLAEVDTDQDDLTLVRTLIEEFGVAVMPGSAFGVEGRCTLRIAYGALDRETVIEGMRRVVRGLTALLR